MEKIGIGILTYNRKEPFLNLIKYLYRNKTDNMYIIVVKDKDIDYGEDFSYMTDDYINVNNNIGTNKNILLTKMIENNCKHLFLIEDDVIINPEYGIEVFNEYIDTAKEFNIGHLCANGITPIQPGNVLTQTITYNNKTLTCWKHLEGLFEYFTDDCIKKCGLFDERYDNAYEHIEHTIRLYKLGFTTGPGYYADIKNSEKYLKRFNPGCSTLPYNTELHNKRINEGCNLLIKMYCNNKTGFTISSNINDSIALLKYRISKKNI